MSIAQHAALAFGMFGSASLALGCGGAPPPGPEDIYHDPGLRRGALEADEADRELLERLGTLPAGEPVSIAGRVYVPAPSYFAASGRACRPVRASIGGTRLACSTEGERWEFVPDVVGGDNPFAIEARASEPPGEPAP